MRHHLTFDKRTFTSHRSGGRYADDGQVSILVVLAVGLFLIMFVGFGVDMTNLFLHRQMAQNAADSACVAAVMDMQRQRINGTCHTAGGTAYPCGNFTKASQLGTAFDCKGNSNYSPCQYAALNGYSSPSATPLVANTETNGVNVSFPASIPGVVTPDASVAGPYPFVEADVYDGVRVYFSSWISGTSTQVVHALAKCGLQTQTQPIPILVLDPTEPKSFQINGNPTIQIVGGPNRSIQVNSDAAAAQLSQDAAYLGGSGGTTTCANASVDLCQAGIKYDGADFGVTGGPPPTPGGFATNSPFGWRSGVNPVGDPFLVLPPPTDPGKAGVVTHNIPYGQNGCPDPSATTSNDKCREYSAGDYIGANNINVQNFTALFDPGVYYIQGGALEFHANSMVRPSGAAGDNSMGTIFYLTCANPGKCTSGNEAYLYVGADSGKITADAFNTSLAHCPGDTPPGWDPRMGIPNTVTGNVLLAPCTTLGTYVGAVMPNVGTDTLGPERGILFFADRSAAPNKGETMNGGGGLLLSGTMYFRDCPALLTIGTCNLPPTDYQTVTTLTGGSGSGTRVFGEIITDQLTLNGNSGITMDLNPWSRPILKVELLQ